MKTSRPFIIHRCDISSSESRCSDLIWQRLLVYCKHTLSPTKKNHHPCTIQTHETFICCSLTVNRNFALFSNLVAFLLSLYCTLLHYFYSFVFAIIHLTSVSSCVFCFGFCWFRFVLFLFLNCLFSVVYFGNFIFWVLYLRPLHHTLCKFLKHIQKKHIACNSLTKTKCAATQFNKLGLSFTEINRKASFVSISNFSSVLNFGLDIGIILNYKVQFTVFR